MLVIHQHNSCENEHVVWSQIWPKLLCQWHNSDDIQCRNTGVKVNHVWWMRSSCRSWTTLERFGSKRWPDLCLISFMVLQSRVSSHYKSYHYLKKCYRKFWWKNILKMINNDSLIQFSIIGSFLIFWLSWW